MGPASLDEIDVSGDPLVTYPFTIPDLPPEFTPPKVTPQTFDPNSDAEVSVALRFFESCFRKIEVVRAYDDRPDIDLLRTLEPYSFRRAGIDSTTWDGRAEDGTLVAPGRYAIRVTAKDLAFAAPLSAATSWVMVV